MEPITLILTALAAGAAAAAHSVGGEALKDAYKALKTLIQQKFSGNPRAEAALDDFEEDPDTYEKPLQKHLTETQTDKDMEIRKKAQELREAAFPQGTHPEQYTTHFHGNAIGVAIGSNAKVVINYGEIKRLVERKMSAENQE